PCPFPIGPNRRGLRRSRGGDTTRSQALINVEDVWIVLRGPDARTASNGERVAQNGNVFRLPRWGRPSVIVDNNIQGTFADRALLRDGRSFDWLSRLVSVQGQEEARIRFGVDRSIAG